MNKYQARIDQLRGKFVDADDFDLGNFMTVSEAELAAVELHIGHPLLPDYREFLRDFGMCFFPYGVMFPVQNENRLPEGDFVDTFYGVMQNRSCGLLANYFTYHEFEQRMPPELLPIADNGAGSQICLALSGNSRGAIYFWDAVYEPETPDYSNVYWVVSSFDEFMYLLQLTE